MDNRELLNYAIANGIIDLSYVQDQIEMDKRKELLEKHPYSKWFGEDGYWHTYLPDEEKGRVAKKSKSETKIDDLIVEYWRAESENPTIKDLFDEWNDRRLRLKKISMPTHQRNRQVYERHYKEFGKYKVKSLSAEVVVEFLEEQIPEHELTSKAFANLKTITRGWIKQAKKLINFGADDVFNELDTSDTDFKKIIKEDYEEVFDEEEMPKIMEYLEANIDMMNLGIILMFVTGIRIGEVVALKHEVFSGNVFKIRRTETRYFDEELGRNVYDIKEYPKSEAGVRTVIIPEDFTWLSKSLKLLNPFSEYIFMKNGKRITTNTIRRRLSRICKKLGIYAKSPHKIRKTYGTILLDNGIDNRLIIGQMGHTDIACTEAHYHRNRRNIERKSEILSNIPDFKAKQKRTKQMFDSLLDSLIITDTPKS